MNLDRINGMNSSTSSLESSSMTSSEMNSSIERMALKEKMNIAMIKKMDNFLIKDDS